MIALILGDIWSQFSSNAIGLVVLGLIALLSTYILVVTAIKVTRETFGRQPPMGSVLKEIHQKLEFVQEEIRKEMKLLVPRTEMEKRQGENLEGQRLRDRGLEEQISKVRHDTSDALMGAMRRGEERDKELRIMADTLSRLQERTETHIRNLDKYDRKMDDLMKDVVQIARRQVKP